LGGKKKGSAKNMYIFPQKAAFAPYYFVSGEKKHCFYETNKLFLCSIFSNTKEKGADAVAVQKGLLVNIAPLLCPPNTFRTRIYLLTTYYLFE